jgi:uncharacterized ferredoxin-like protein
MKRFEDIRKSALKDVAEFMCVAARTAPKTCGRDNLIIGILEGSEKIPVMAKMEEISARDNRPSCLRDAGNIKDIEHIVIIGVKRVSLGLNCGFCGYKTCADLEKTKSVCAFNSMDLGIALGSAVSIAADFRADNRLMYSIGRAALELGMLEDAVQAIGIPLSATGKNPFFDRK